MTKSLPSFKTSESLGQLIKELNRWTGGSTDTTFKRMLAAWLDSDDTQDMPEDLRNKAEGFLARTTPTKGWVVYEHREVDTHAVRYVGKGRPARAWSKDRTDPEHTKKLNAEKLEVVLVMTDLSEQDALKDMPRKAGEFSRTVSLERISIIEQIDEKVIPGTLNSDLLI